MPAGYCHVRSRGNGVLHMPSGGNFTGGTEPVKVSEDVTAGWYRCTYAWHRMRVYVSLGKKVDPAKEAERLEKASLGGARARTQSPGIQGFQQRADAAYQAQAALRTRQRSFAKVLRDGALKANRRRKRTTRPKRRTSR